MKLFDKIKKRVRNLFIVDVIVVTTKWVHRIKFHRFGRTEMISTIPYNLFGSKLRGYENELVILDESSKMGDFYNNGKKR